MTNTIVKYFQKKVNKSLNKKKMSNYITQDINISFDDSDRENSGEENSNE